MQVSFEPRIPFDRSNPMAAALITYEIPWTKDNENAMKGAFSPSTERCLPQVCTRYGVKNRCQAQEWGVLLIQPDWKSQAPKSP